MVEEELENIDKIEIEKEAEVSIIQDDDDSEKKKWRRPCTLQWKET